MSGVAWAVRRRLADDDRGISIVEVLVAITILAVTMAATASGVIRSLQVASDSRNTTVAANIAQFELERLRSIPFADWVTSIRDGTQTDTLTTTHDGTGPNGLSYEVSREAGWVAAGSATTDCSVFGDGDTEADYVRVRQVVSFPAQPDLLPVENVTIISPRLDDSDAYTGHLAVMVRDRDGVGTQGHTVRIQGAAGVELATTDTNGCAFFALLPVEPGDPIANTYEITIDTDGYVDRSRKVQLIEDSVVISAQSTTVMEFAYDEAVGYDLFPTIPTTPFSGCVAQRVVFASPSGADDPTAFAVDPEPTPYQPGQQAVECRTDPSDPGTALATDGTVGGSPVWRAFIPYNLGYTVYNSSTDFSPLGRVTSYPSWTETAIPDTQTRDDAEVCGLYDDDTGECISRVLYPYTGGYSVHPGRCRASDPVTALGESERQALPADPGTEYETSVPMALVTFTTVQGDDSLQGYRDVYADIRDGDVCPDGERLYLGRSDGTTAELTALMPYGAWVFHWDDQGDGVMRSASTGLTPFACADVPSNCTEIRPDGAGSSGFPSIGYQIDVQRGDDVTG